VGAQRTRAIRNLAGKGAVAGSVLHVRGQCLVAAAVGHPSWPSFFFIFCARAPSSRPLKWQAVSDSKPDRARMSSSLAATEHSATFLGYYYDGDTQDKAMMMEAPHHNKATTNTPAAHTRDVM
jgi:hypothetical protein